MDLTNIVAALKEQRTRVDQAIAALEGVASPSQRGRPPKAASNIGRQGRHMSAAARKRISDAMKQRWAKRKGKSAAQKTKPRPAISAAGRKKLSDLMKARWAAKKKANA